MNDVTEQGSIDVANECQRDGTYRKNIAKPTQLLFETPVPKSKLYPLVSDSYFVALEITQKIQQQVAIDKLKLTNENRATQHSLLTSNHLGGLGLFEWTPFELGLKAIIDSRLNIFKTPVRVSL